MMRGMAPHQHFLICQACCSSSLFPLFGGSVSRDDSELSAGGLMDIFDEIVQERPHLKETLELYKKVLKIKSMEVVLEGELPMDARGYSGDDLRKIMDEMSQALGINRDLLEPLEELLLSGEVDLRGLPLGTGLPRGVSVEDEAFAFLYILSKPYFIAESKRLNLGDIYWTEGRCPVCNALPSVAFIGREEKRRFYCTFCETVGPWQRTGCPTCQSESPEMMNILYLEGEDGMRADLCEECRNYFKSFDYSLRARYSPDILDLISLPFDIIAQGKGYRRPSPNPLGMIRMA
ncbi:MAG TPA: formate dehydrogenase accessory protein FdhE [Nitrospirae bacterium]|nr:formate dehydrogenase accessory protein FdhE [Nitrospirota bacterium]